MEYILFDKVKEELSHYFFNNPDPDYITFSGSGEPTLNIRIGEVLNFIKALKPTIPVALLTNGTLFYDESLRKEILNADIILPSLDAATEKAFHLVNRPAEGIDIKKYIDGLVVFRKEYSGKIWLEILIIPEFNDDPENIHALKDAIAKIQPDKIQLNTLDRPGSENDLRPASRAELLSILELWNIPNVEIIAAPASRKKIIAYREDTESAILETIYRRPCTALDISNILGIHLNETNKYLDVLEAEGKVHNIRKERGIFYQVKKEGGEF
jgi:wyosine [tRNA(Phe)-imidazoG37] synthetase (radical SAM superfamily)